MRPPGGRDRSVRVVVELAAADDRQPLVEEAHEQPRHPCLGLPALPEEDQVVPGEDRVLDRWEHGLLEPDDGRQHLGAARQPLQEIRPKLLLDGPRSPAGGPQLGDGGGAGRARHEGPQFGMEALIEADVVVR